MEKIRISNYGFDIYKCYNRIIENGIKNDNLTK